MQRDMGTMSAMEAKLQRGQKVVVRMYGGEVAEKIVVTDLGRTVIVSDSVVFDRAVQEGREPDGVGFPRRDVSPLETQGK